MAIIAKGQKGYYQVLVYVAYAYFICFSGVWLFETFSKTGKVNLFALPILIIFITQFFWKNKLLNLILGILGLAISIWMLLETFSQFDLFRKGAEYDTVVKMLIAISVVSIILSGILIFSYLMLNKNNE